MFVKDKKQLLEVTVTPLTLKKTFRYENTDMVIAEVTVAQVGPTVPPAAGRRINAFYRLLAARKMLYAEKTLYKSAVSDWTERMANGYPFNPYSFTVNYSVALNAAGLFSLYYDVYEYTGGAHGNTVRYGDTWSLSSGYPFARLFPPKCRPGLLKQITADAEARERAAPGTFFPGIRQNTRKYFEPDQSYLTPDGLVIFYQLYTVAPYVTGITSFPVKCPLAVKVPPVTSDAPCSGDEAALPTRGEKPERAACP